ncbi:hypothetical protein D3C81_1846890 [compost metagenome]
MMHRIGVVIAALEKHPVGGARIMAGNMAEADTGFLHFAPFSADVLALLALQRCQEFVEIAIAGIEPVELHATAQHETGLP